MVSDFSCFVFDGLAVVFELINTTLSVESAKEYMDESRINAIAETVNRRIQNLMQLSVAQAPAQADSTEDDVEENIAEDYSQKVNM